MLCPSCLRRPTYNGNPMCSLCLGDKAKAEKKANKPTKQQKAIPKISPKKADRNAQLKKLRDKKLKETPYCETCLKTSNLTYSHIIPVGNNKELELHPDNAMVQCINCHFDYEFKGLDAKMSQSTWERCKEVMLRLKPEYYHQLMLKKK